MTLTDQDRELIARTVELLREGRVVEERMHLIEVDGALALESDLLVALVQGKTRVCGCVCGDLMIARVERGLEPGSTLNGAVDPLMSRVWEVAGIDFTDGNITAAEAADRLERELLGVVSA